MESILERTRHTGVSPSKPANLGTAFGSLARTSDMTLSLGQLGVGASNIINSSPTYPPPGLTGAIPKASSASSSPSGNDVISSKAVGGAIGSKWPDSGHLALGSVSWACTEASLKVLNMNKEMKKFPQNEVGQSTASTLGKSLSSVASVLSSKPKDGCNASSITSVTPHTSSAYGLGDITVNASVAARTLPTPTTPTSTKPKFKNLRSSNNCGAIGTLPPKLVRPQPRQATSLVSLVSGTKDTDLSGSVSYKRLIEECKDKFGKEFTLPDIHKAIRDVREHNKNSLSGLSFDMIMERVQNQLRSQQVGSGKPSVAPWANLTQNKSGPGGHAWKGVRMAGMDGISEDECGICLDQLDSSTTMPLPCQHVFHNRCIKPWLKLKSDCPICRNFTLMNDEYPSLTPRK